MEPRLAARQLPTPARPKGQHGAFYNQPTSAITLTMTTPRTPGFDVDDRPPPPPTTRVAKPDDAITLRGIRVPLNSDVGAAFVADLARNKERLLSDDRVIEKYDITPDNWTEITQSKAVRLAVNAEHERR